MEIVLMCSFPSWTKTLADWVWHSPLDWKVVAIIEFGIQKIRQMHVPYYYTCCPVASLFWLSRHLWRNRICLRSSWRTLQWPLPVRTRFLTDRLEGRWWRGGRRCKSRGGRCLWTPSVGTKAVCWFRLFYWTFWRLWRIVDLPGKWGFLYIAPRVLITILSFF